MKDFIDWLMRDEQEELYQFVFGLFFNLVSMGVCALVLWPFGRAGVTLHWLKGFGLLWAIGLVAVSVLVMLQKLFRVNQYDRHNVFIFSNLAVGGALQLGWAAFAVLTLQPALGSSTLLAKAVLYLVGALSCYTAYIVVSVFFKGTLYALTNLALALIGFITFCLWPRGAQLLVGWLVGLF